MYTNFKFKYQVPKIDNLIHNQALNQSISGHIYILLVWLGGSR